MHVTILRVKKPVSRASQESQISLSRDMSISQYPVGSPSPPTLGLNIDRCSQVVTFYPALPQHVNDAIAGINYESSVFIIGHC